MGVPPQKKSSIFVGFSMKTIHPRRRSHGRAELALRSACDPAALLRPGKREDLADLGDLGVSIAMGVPNNSQ